MRLRLHVGRQALPLRDRRDVAQRARDAPRSHGERHRVRPRRRVAGVRPHPGRRTASARRTLSHPAHRRALGDRVRRRGEARRRRSSRFDRRLRRRDVRAARPGEAAPLSRRCARAAAAPRSTSVAHDVLPALRASDDVYVSNLSPRAIRASSSRTISSWTSARMPVARQPVLFLRGWIYPTDASINVALSQQSDHQRGAALARGARRAWQMGRRRSQPWLPVGQGQDDRRRPRRQFPDGRSSRAHPHEHADLLGPGVRRPRADRRHDEAHHARAALRRSSRPRLLADVSQGWSLRPLLVRLRLAWRSSRRGDRSTGAFTRFGDVLPLLRAPDDQYVIMAPGDEATLQFDAALRRARCRRAGGATSCSTPTAGSRTRI